MQNDPCCGGYFGEFSQACSKFVATLLNAYTKPNAAKYIATSVPSTAHCGILSCINTTQTAHMYYDGSVFAKTTAAVLLQSVPFVWAVYGGVDIVDTSLVQTTNERWDSPVG